MRVGYLGGGVLLAINLVMIQKPAWFGIPDAGTAVRLSLASVGVWWLVFSIPIVPPGTGAAAGRRGRGEAGRQSPVDRRHAADRDVQGAAPYKQAFMLLVAFLIYNDGIQTIIRMATTLRHGDRHRRERDDHGAADHAVHRRPVRVPVRHARRPHRREDGRLRRARRLRDHHHPRLLHDHARRISTRSRCSSGWCRAARRR